MIGGVADGPKGSKRVQVIDLLQNKGFAAVEITEATPIIPISPSSMSIELSS